MTIDDSHNQKGEKLIIFINDIKGCIVTGRVTPEHDGFMSVTAHKGRAVVDYHIVRQTDLKMVREMEVRSVVEVVDDLGIQSLVTDICRVPDHNLLMMEIEPLKL